MELIAELYHIAFSYESLNEPEYIEKAIFIFKESLKELDNLTDNYNKLLNLRNKALCISCLGDAYKSLGGVENFETALIHYYDANDLWQKYLSQRENSEDMQRLAMNYYAEGEIYETVPRIYMLKSALSFYSQAIDTSKKSIEAGNKDAYYIYILALDKFVNSELLSGEYKYRTLLIGTKIAEFMYKETQDTFYQLFIDKFAENAKKYAHFQ